jgi:cysteine desulfurase
MTLYLDYAATTPVDQRVAEIVMHFMREEFGNAGSRTHQRGAVAKAAVEVARRHIADVVAADPSDVIFTSGATEANNLTLLGLREHGAQTRRQHIISTAIEHKAVLEPLQAMQELGYEVELIRPSSDGCVAAEEVLGRVRDDTLLVSVMHANNETGVLQPIVEIAESLPDHVLMHTDAAQTFSKLLEPLRHPRLDLITCSAHKIFGPKGVGALISRRRNRKRAPLKPLMVGGGQERGLRPGTLAVPLLTGFGEAARLAVAEHEARTAKCESLRAQIVEGLANVGAVPNGSGPQLPHIANLSIPRLDSEAAIVLLKEVAHISNGSACTSEKYEPSHVLTAMGLPRDRCLQAIRLSWSHLTEEREVERFLIALPQLVGAFR